MADGSATAFPIVNACVVLAAGGVALWLRPWRCLGTRGPPWSWVAVWALLPIPWGLERLIGASAVQPMTGAALLVLLAGWPLTVVALLPVAAVTVLTGHLGWIEGLDRLVGSGIVPATLVLAIGWGVRRWLPRHPFAYILGRGYLGTLLACALAGAASLALQAPAPEIDLTDRLVAQILLAFGEASLTGTLIAIFVTCRPDWVATYSERLYPPPKPRDQPRIRRPARTAVRAAGAAPGCGRARRR